MAGIGTADTATTLSSSIGVLPGSEVLEPEVVDGNEMVAAEPPQTLTVSTYDGPKEIEGNYPLVIGGRATNFDALLSEPAAMMEGARHFLGQGAKWFGWGSQTAVQMTLINSNYLIPAGAAIACISCGTIPGAIILSFLSGIALSWVRGLITSEIVELAGGSENLSFPGKENSSEFVRMFASTLSPALWRPGWKPSRPNEDKLVRSAHAVSKELTKSTALKWLRALTVAAESPNVTTNTFEAILKLGTRTPEKQTHTFFDLPRALTPSVVDGFKGLVTKSVSAAQKLKIMSGYNIHAGDVAQIPIEWAKEELLSRGGSLYDPEFILNPALYDVSRWLVENGNTAVLDWLIAQAKGRSVHSDMAVLALAKLEADENGSVRALTAERTEGMMEGYYKNFNPNEYLDGLLKNSSKYANIMVLIDYLIAKGAHELAECIKLWANADREPHIYVWNELKESKRPETIAVVEALEEARL